MYCCEKCFIDGHIKEMIKKAGKLGSCDFCHSKKVYIYDVSCKSNDVANLLIDIVQIYEVSSNKLAKSIEESLKNDWDIFNLESEQIIALIKESCKEFFVINNALLTEKVIVPQTIDDDFLKENGVMSGYSWSEFARSIKKENRFHNKMFKPDVFVSFLSVAVNKYNDKNSFYRARIARNLNGYSESEMGAPPHELASNGRINPEGIPVLYVASDSETVLYEARATVFDYVTIGEFKTYKEIRVVDLSAVLKISPFSYLTDLVNYFINRSIFQEISRSFAKPLRRNDSYLEYLPTQYIAEFIKSQGYDGIKYDSTMHNGGYNIAFFDANVLSCIDVHTVEICDLHYEVESCK